MVATRSGRLTGQEPVAVPEAKPKKAGRTSSKAKQSGDKHQQATAYTPLPAPRFGHESPTASMDNDVMTADVFKTDSPVKISKHTTPQRAAYTPLVMADNVGRSPKQPATTPGKSVRERVQEVSSVPLPQNSLDSHASSEEDEEVRPRQLHETKRLQGKGLLLALVITLTAVTICCGANAWLCHGQGAKVFPQAQPFCSNVAAFCHTTSRASVDAKNSVYTYVSTQSTAFYKTVQNSYRAAIEYMRSQTYAVKSHVIPAVAQLSAKLKAIKTTGPRTSFADILTSSSLERLAHQGSNLAYVADIYHQAQHQQQAQHKAPAFIITCYQACSEVQSSLTSAVTQPNNVLSLDGKNFSAVAAAGNLQATLANFLQQHPASVVILGNLYDMSLASLSVINNALSENGSLQLNGKTIVSSHALFIAVLPTTVQHNSEDFENEVKAELQQRIAAAGAEGDILARTLRRRFEHALPSADDVYIKPAEPIPVPQEPEQQNQVEQQVEGVNDQQAQLLVEAELHPELAVAQETETEQQNVDTPATSSEAVQQAFNSESEPAAADMSAVQ